MLEDGDEELPEVDLDSESQLREAGVLEAFVVGEGELAGVEVDLGEVGSPGVAVEPGTAFVGFAVAL